MERLSRESRIIMAAGMLAACAVIFYGMFEVPIAYVGFKDLKNTSAESFVLHSFQETANESPSADSSQNGTEKNYYADVKASSKTSAEKADAAFPININTASANELTALDGIGPAKAQAIVDYRRENGKFSSKKDITSVSGIGEKTYEKIKDKITV